MRASPARPFSLGTAWLATGEAAGFPACIRLGVALPANGFAGGADFTAAGAVEGFALAIFGVAGTGAAGFRAPAFLVAAVFGFRFFGATCLAAIFLAVLVPPLAGFLTADFVTPAFRVWARDRAVLLAAVLVAAGFFSDVRAVAAVCFLDRTGLAFGRAVLAAPRAVRPGARPFAAAAFVGGRRVDLLRGVDAIGTTLVTVVAWYSQAAQVTREQAFAPPYPVDTGE